MRVNTGGRGHLDRTESRHLDRTYHRSPDLSATRLGLPAAPWLGSATAPSAPCPGCLGGGASCLAKKLQQRVAELTTECTTTVELWCQDEARFGFKPSLRKVWAPRGQRPRAPGQTRYEWLYVYGFVRPSTGQTYRLILPTVNTEAMTLALAEFARDIGAGGDKRILLVVDNAGWHGSKTLRVPGSIELVYLPPAIPELQPAEHLWPLLREAVANQTFAALDPLQDTLVEPGLQLADQPEIVHSTTNFHWLPAV